MLEPQTRNIAKDFRKTQRPTYEIDTLPMFFMRFLPSFYFSRAGGKL